MPIRTIYAMAQDCSRGEREGWYEFVRDYGGIARRMIEHYFPMLAPELGAHVLGLFQRARANQNEWFRQISFSFERDFAMVFRELLFSYGRETARVPVPQLSLDQLRQIMQDLPLVEREMLWLFIKGYSAKEIAPMILNAAATAEEVKKIADQRLAQILPGTSPDAFNISARVLMVEAEKTKSDQCVATKTFNNIVNGQISWREREVAEEHIRDCFNCLDRFSAFQEMIYLRKSVQPLPDAEVEKVLEGLNLPSAKAKGILGRLFSKV